MDEVIGLKAIVKTANDLLAHVYVRVTKAKLNPQYGHAVLRAKQFLQIDGKTKPPEIPILVQLSGPNSTSIDNIAIAIRQGLFRTNIRLDYGLEFKKPLDDPEVIRGLDAIQRAADNLLKQCNARALRVVRDGAMIQIKISGTWQYTGKGFDSLARIKLSEEQTVSRSDLIQTLTGALKRDGVKVKLG